MSISALQAIVQQPLNPVERVTQEQWDIFELVTGVPLPADYKAFLSAYGTGIIGGVITLYNPFCRRLFLKSHYTYKSWLQEALAITEHKQRYGVDIFPYTLYPQENGVLPWGSTDNGDRLYWVTKGDPSQWTILMQEVRSSYFEHFEVNMSMFITSIITGNIRSSIIPVDCIDSVFEIL